MAKPTYRERYPQFEDENGKFDEKTFDIKEMAKEDIEDILSRRKTVEIYLDNLENIIDNPLESIGIITLMIYRYSRKVDLLIEEIRSEIKKAINDEKLAESTYRDFRWFAKNLKLGTEGYIKNAVANGFKPKKSRSSETEQESFIGNNFTPKHLSPLRR